jgi:rod shape determining protein RodA
MIYSATLSTEEGGILSSHVFRQALFAVIGFGLLFVVISFDYDLLSGLAVPIYLFALALMVVVLVLGQVTHGSQRWIDLGFTTIEPSELGKIAVIIALAKFLSDHEEDVHKFKYVVLSALLIVPFFALTVLQPNLGTAIVFIVIWLSMIAMAGLRFFHAFLFGAAALAAAPIAWFTMHDYMRERIQDFLNPQADPLGSGYNVIQALISVGSGGILGRGFTSGTQSQLHFLRVQYADFIFSVMAEELGFIGALLLFALFVGLLLRGLRTASIARDSFGRLLATAIVTMIGFQAFVNVGINVGLLPVTGLPLPFISYGGSSIITFLIGIGLIESVAMHRQKADF